MSLPGLSQGCEKPFGQFQELLRVLSDIDDIMTLREAKTDCSYRREPDLVFMQPDKHYLGLHDAKHA